METNKSCKICGHTATYHGYSIEKDFEAVTCSYCGKYYESSLFETDIYLDQSNFYKVSSWIREQNDEFNNTPEIDRDKFDKILDMRDKKIQEKFDLMIRYINDRKTIKDIDIYVRCWLKNEEEFYALVDELYYKSYIDATKEKLSKNSLNTWYQFHKITFKGLEYLESLEQPNKSSKNIFVAFNFDDELTKVFNTFVKEAIVELDFNYTIVTQDTTPHETAISDEIISKLKSSRMIIADFTNHRNSVYFEAGFAMGMKIPIIWTCKEGHDKELSFDTRQYPHLIWKDGEDLKKQITDRIKVIL